MFKKKRLHQQPLCVIIFQVRTNVSVLQTYKAKRKAEGKYEGEGPVLCFEGKSSA